MALLVNVFVNQLGASPSLVAASAGGDTFHAKPTGLFHVKNASGSPITVTISNTVDQVNLAGFGDIPLQPISVIVPATTGEKYIFVPPQAYGSGGTTTVTYSGVTSLTVEYIELERA